MRKAIFSFIAILSLTAGVLVFDGAKETSAKPKTEPVIDFYYVWKELYVGFDVSDLQNYSQMRYEITYFHDGGLSGGIAGTIGDLRDQTEISREKLILGTCSSGGTCIYDKVESPITLTVEFSKSPSKFVVHHRQVLVLN